MAFVKNRSTTDVLLNQIQYFFDSIDSGNSVFSLFLNLKKAFDSLVINILLSKLYFYAFRSLLCDLLKSYLTGRSQRARINTEVSDLGFLTQGVPQGSIPVPLLSLIFINDLPKSDSFFKVVSYADDSTLSFPIHRNLSVEDNKQFRDLHNAEPSNVSDWLNVSKNMVNLNKANYTIFSYKRKLLLSEIKYNNIELKKRVN